MTKEKKYEFKIVDFCKYVFAKWPILLCCLIIGACASLYSWKHQSASYESMAVILFHDKIDTAGDGDEYDQILTILNSKESYLEAGAKEDEIAFDGIEVSGVATGVVKVIAMGESEGEALKKVEFVINNSEKTLNHIFTENSFESFVLTKPGEATAKGTKKEKLLSVAIIMMATVVLAIGIDFVGFNKKVEK